MSYSPFLSVRDFHIMLLVAVDSYFHFLPSEFCLLFNAHMHQNKCTVLYVHTVYGVGTQKRSVYTISICLSAFNHCFPSASAEVDNSSFFKSGGNHPD